MTPRWSGPARALQLQSGAKTARRAALPLSLHRLSAVSNETELLGPVWTPVSACIPMPTCMPHPTVFCLHGVSECNFPVVTYLHCVPKCLQTKTQGRQGSPRRLAETQVASGPGCKGKDFHRFPQGGGGGGGVPRSQRETTAQSPSHLLVSFPCIFEKCF